MKDFKIRDPKLASQGRLQIEWATKHMPVLTQIKQRFGKERPFKNMTIGACLHVTKETGALVETFMAGGAEVALCGSNPLSTQDEIAARLAQENVHVFAWRAQKTDEYFGCIERTLDY